MKKCIVDLFYQFCLGVLIMLSLILLLVGIIGEAKAEVSVTASLMPGGEGYSDSLQGKVRVGQSEGFYLHGSWTEKDKVAETQPIGSMAIYNFGVGYRQQVHDNVVLWAEIGHTNTKNTLIDFAVREDIYHGLVLLYGGPERQPPFLGDKHWGLLDYDYRVRTNLMAEVGASYNVSKHLQIEVSYYLLNVREHYAIWNPDWNGGPGVGGVHAPNRIDCGCFWEGHKYNQLGSFKLGVTYRF